MAPRSPRDASMVLTEIQVYFDTGTKDALQARQSETELPSTLSPCLPKHTHSRDAKIHTQREREASKKKLLIISRRLRTSPWPLRMRANAKSEPLFSGGCNVAPSHEGFGFQAGYFTLFWVSPVFVQYILYWGSKIQGGGADSVLLASDDVTIIFRLSGLFRIHFVLDSKIQGFSLG